MPIRQFARKLRRLIGGKTVAKPSALLATAGCEGRLSKFVERSESKPTWACNRGKVAKSANAQIPNAITCYNGRIRKQEGMLNEGSLYPCPFFFQD